MNLGKKISSLFLAIMLVLGLVPQTVFAEETITSPLQYEIKQDVSEDNLTATISLTFGEMETVQVEKVNLPDGTEQTDDLSAISYNVTENGSYEFLVTYITDGKTQEETIPVEVTSFEEKSADEKASVETEETEKEENQLSELSIEGETYTVSTPDEWTQALSEIEASSSNEATIILSADDITKNNKFAGVKGKHITVKSAGENVYGLYIEYKLEGDITLDNVSLKGNRTNTFYANGHLFETTENFSKDPECIIDRLYGGGSKGNNVNGNTNIILRGNIRINHLYGGGFDSDVTGDTSILIDGANVKVQILYGGGHAKNTESGKVYGNTNIQFRQGTNGRMFGGGCNEYSDVNSRIPATVTGTVNISVGYEDAPAHAAEFGTATYAYGGSWHSTVGNVKFQILDGAWSDRGHTGRNYYGCGFRDTIRGTVEIHVDGADLDRDTIYGGGDLNPTGSLDSEYGRVEILNENNEQYALKITYSAEVPSEGINAGSHYSVPTFINGDTLIDIQNGNMNFVVLDNEEQGNCTINGTGIIKIKNSDIAQVQGNKNHYTVETDTGKSICEYDGSGNETSPQKTGYLYYFQQVNLKNKANVIVTSKNFSDLLSVTQKPFYSVKDITVNEKCKLTTDGNQAYSYGNLLIEGTFEQLYVKAENYLDLWVQGTTEIGENGILISHGTTSLKGNVTSKGIMALMNPSNFASDYVGVNSELRLPVVIDNYDGTDTGGDIALNIDGTISGETTVITVDIDNWKNKSKPKLGDNYITGLKINEDKPIEANFLLGNEDAILDGYYLKRVVDPADEDGYYMWQVAKKDSYGVTYDFISGTQGKRLPDVITNLLPIDPQKYIDGSIVTAIQPDETEIKVADGVWTFEGYDVNSKTANFENADKNGNIKFTGIWKFKSNSIPINAIPTINAGDKTITVGDTFDPIKHVTATDKEDGEITDKIEILKNEVDTSKAGVYEVTYKVTDSKGASATKTIYVTVNPKMEELNAIPTINASDKTLTVGDTFDPLKDVTASDKEDGDITEKVEVLSNDVDTSKAGTYTVIYKVTDSKGASSTKTITVTVKAKDTQNPTTDDSKKPSATNTDKKPASTDKQTTSNSPKTGDSTNMTTWLALMFVSLGLLAGVFTVRKSRKGR